MKSLIPGIQVTGIVKKDERIVTVEETPVAKEVNENYGGKVNYEGKLMWSEKLRRELYGYS